MEAGIQILHRCGGGGCSLGSKDFFLPFIFRPNCIFFSGTRIWFGDPYPSVLIFVFFFLGYGAGRCRAVWGFGVFIVSNAGIRGGFFLKKKIFFLRTERRGRLKPFFQISVLLGQGVGGICILIHSVHVQAAYVLQYRK